MLKALEISGFKSFADKTRFEFPEGITVIVGPNGSGKSNIVDAIKWVLGEQSAKSLRGKDMSDVIFKGSSGAGARKPAGSATAVIILDNTQRSFPYDADEVHVGRRVFRNGETEYLLNGETARLKDIKNMLRGTGIGTDAYSLIEQGKVDRLLQASPKDRRAIFEEAAGISRFKAKKTEATRRLQRVDESLIRLADIVDEVGSRYRSVKSQATKAAKYKEYSERLQQLRTFVGMKDWRNFSEQLAEKNAESESNQTQLDQLESELQTAEADAHDTEELLKSVASDLAKLHEQASEEREKVAQTESRITLNESRLADIDARSERLGDQQTRLQQRTALAKNSLEETKQEAEEAEKKLETAHSRLEELHQQLQNTNVEISTAGEHQLSLDNRHSELLSLIGELGRVVSGADSQVETLNAAKSRYLNDVQTLTKLAEDRQADYEQLLQEQESLKQQATETDSNLAQVQARLSETTERLNEAKAVVVEKNNLRTGISQRASVIEELEKKLEGINAGARELLQLAQNANSTQLGVVGLVADLVTVNVQHAAIVDAALGNVAQYVVVRGSQIVSDIAAEQLKVEGRVGILPLDEFETLNSDPQIDLSEFEGIIGRASELVTAQDSYQEFIHRLLGGTWVVKSLAQALFIQRNSSPDVRFVTLDGEVLESDGTIVVGPKSSAEGLVSRRSELRSLRRQLLELENEIPEAEIHVDNLENEFQRYTSRSKELLKQNSDFDRKLAKLSSQTESLKSELNTVSERLRQAKTDLEQTTQRLETLTSQLRIDRDKLNQSEAEVVNLLALLAEQKTNSARLQQRKAELETTATEAKVALAKLEQAKETQASRLQQLRQDLDAVQQASDDLEMQIQTDAKDRTKAEQEIEVLKSDLQQLLEQKSSSSDRLEKLNAQRDELDEKRKREAKEIDSVRNSIRKLKDKQFQTQLQIEQLRNQREQLAERLREDYQIDIANVESVELSEEQLAQREALDEEITELRKQLSAIGSVNVDALNELEELEDRYTRMDEQYRDLVQAKETLERIISRINADSRRLFVETLEAIRGNFQKLFRQTFGGGQADIIIEEGVDPLEAGVDIVATPPGKPQVSNSLLSGGEKALTAVSLLMAIFQFRPSPFCVLDEVDAPFDEANIGRFIDVLRSFLGWTKFVIVTHSKKTMTAATTLYGVTMQESGVSKRVSVRFEDVSEDGEISKEAIERDDEAA